MAKTSKKSFHTGAVKKTITIKSSKDKVWRKISNIIGLPTWVVDVKKTVYLSKKKRDVGAIRLITFADGSKIEEHVVAWKNKEYFTYIATEGYRHPIFSDALRPLAEAAISREDMLIRYPPDPLRGAWRESRNFTDDDVRENWNTNARRWDANYDDDGDRNRRYLSDEPMLELLGPVSGLKLLDVGSGNGYLCRKLARAGASMCGVELSDEFYRISLEREAEDQLGIEYHNRSATDMRFFTDSTFDKAVSNYVLMDIAEYELAISEVARVLKPGGTFVVVISHPAFSGGPGTYWIPAADSPRREDRELYFTDNYFHRGPYLGAWANFDPVLSFHRPIRDFWKAFQAVGFRVDDFEEPSITERGRRELPAYRVQQALRVPYSCIFKLVKVG